MKVLFLYSYYKPERTSGAHLAEDLRKSLVDAGHTIQIYAPVPSRCVTKEVHNEYRKKKNETEMNGAIKVYRFSLYREGQNPFFRALRYFIMEVQLLWFGLVSKKADIIPMGSTPPINGITATLIKKIRRIPFVYIVQDLFPESLVNARMTCEGSFLWKIGCWISNLTYRNAAHIIVITDSMMKQLVAKGVPKEKISVVYNWIDTDAVRPVKRNENVLFDELSLEKDKFYVTYAGNLGNSQNVELLVDCAEQLIDYKDIKFVIFGDGSNKEKIVNRIINKKLNNICIFPMQPENRISEVYSLGDISFVICKKGVGKSAFPSKAISIMSAGTPIIASFDIDSDLCRIIKKENIGLCVEPEDINAAVDAILKLYKNRKLCQEYGANGRKLACSMFSKKINVEKRVSIIEKYAICNIKK